MSKSVITCRSHSAALPVCLVIFWRRLQASVRIIALRGDAKWFHPKPPVALWLLLYHPLVLFKPTFLRYSTQSSTATATDQFVRRLRADIQDTGNLRALQHTTSLFWLYILFSEAGPSQERYPISSIAYPLRTSHSNPDQTGIYP